jgi:hypothetical protein
VVHSSGPRVSLHEIHRLTPVKSWDEVLGQAELEGLSPDAAVWSLERIPLNTVDPKTAFYENPGAAGDIEGEATIDRLAAALRAKESLPPLLLAHVPGMPEDRGDYHLWDGSHRFTAATREGRNELQAWVAHSGGCCDIANQ